MGKEGEGSSHGLIQGTILAFAWSDWGKPQRTSVETVGLQAEICIQDLSHTKHEHQPLNHNIWLAQY
jgi:hypothetical protein